MKEAINQVRECPYCKEEIMASAIKCKHCKSNLISGIQHSTIRYSKPC